MTQSYEAYLRSENRRLKIERNSLRKKVNKALLRLIEKRGLKKKWIAEKVGVSPTYLSSILRNKSKPKTHNQIIDRILKVIVNGKV